MSGAAPFVDVCGFPEHGEPVAPTPRAAEHLIAGGWTPPPSRWDTAIRWAVVLIVATMLYSTIEPFPLRIVCMGLVVWALLGVLYQVGRGIADIGRAS